MISCVASDTIVLVPFASTTGTMVQNTPIGVKYITVLITFCKCSNRVGRDQSFYRIQNTVHLCCLNIGCHHLKADTFSKVDHSRNHQSYKACNYSCCKKEQHGRTGDMFPVSLIKILHLYSPYLFLHKSLKSVHF